MNVEVLRLRASPDNPVLIVAGQKLSVVEVEGLGIRTACVLDVTTARSLSPFNLRLKSIEVDIDAIQPIIRRFK